MQTLEELIAKLPKGYKVTFQRNDYGVEIVLLHPSERYAVDCNVLDVNIEAAVNPALATALKELTEQTENSLGTL